MPRFLAKEAAIVAAEKDPKLIAVRFEWRDMGFTRLACQVIPRRVYEAWERDHDGRPLKMPSGLCAYNLKPLSGVLQ